jgi:hypothetical protein
LFEENEPRSVLLDTTHERPLQHLEVIDSTGRPLRSSDTFVRKVAH